MIFTTNLLVNSVLSDRSKNLGGTIDLHLSVCQSICLDRPIDSAQTMYQIFLFLVSRKLFMVPKDRWSRIFEEKKLLAKNGEKCVKICVLDHFSATGHQIFYFWYETSLIYYFKYSIGNFARTNFLGGKWQKQV